MEFAYGEKVKIIRGFYKGRTGKILEQRNTTSENRSYYVEVYLGDESPKKIEVLATDMKVKGILDSLIP